MVNFPKKMSQAYLSKNCATLYFLIHFNYFFKHWSIMMGYMKQTKLTSVNFSKKSLLSISGQFLSNLTENYNTLHLNFCYTLRILLRHCSVMEYNKQTTVVLVNFSPKFLFSSKRKICAQFEPKSFNLISHDLSGFFLKHFSMMGAQQIETLVSFRFSTIMHFEPNLGQNYAALCPRQLCHRIYSPKILRCSIIG